jgi:hemimethylated DNA binding protein
MWFITGDMATGGVVFERDPACMADEAWYLANKTQPPRDQPWCHVMVDGAERTTYVAESNLEPDAKGGGGAASADRPGVRGVRRRTALAAESELKRIETSHGRKRRAWRKSCFTARTARRRAWI